MTRALPILSRVATRCLLPNSLRRTRPLLCLSLCTRLFASSDVSSDGKLQWDEVVESAVGTGVSAHFGSVVENERHCKSQIKDDSTAVPRSVASSEKSLRVLRSVRKCEYPSEVLKVLRDNCHLMSASVYCDAILHTANRLRRWKSAITIFLEAMASGKPVSESQTSSHPMDDSKGFALSNVSIAFGKGQAKAKRKSESVETEEWTALERAQLYECIVTALCRADQMQAALDYFWKFREFSSVKPSHSLLSTLLMACKRQARFSDYRRMADRISRLLLKDYGYEATAADLVCLMAVHRFDATLLQPLALFKFTLQNEHSSWSIHDKLRRVRDPLTRREADINATAGQWVAGTLLSLCKRNANIAVATEVAKLCAANGVKLNTDSVNALLSTHLSCGQPLAAAMLFATYFGESALVQLLAPLLSDATTDSGTLQKGENNPNSMSYSLAKSSLIKCAIGRMKVAQTCERTDDSEVSDRWLDSALKAVEQMHQTHLSRFGDSLNAKNKRREERKLLGLRMAVCGRNDWTQSVRLLDAFLTEHCIEPVKVHSDGHSISEVRIDVRGFFDLETRVLLRELWRNGCHWKGANLREANRIVVVTGVGSNSAVLRRSDELSPMKALIVDEFSAWTPPVSVCEDPNDATAMVVHSTANHSFWSSAHLDSFCPNTLKTGFFE